MGVLVDDLLLLARMDQGRPVEREQVDLGRVATDAVEAALAVDPERPIDLVVRTPSDVSADAGRLRQVLDNLLDNARAHTPDGTPVHVRVAPVDGEVELAVEDEGPGLTPEAEDRVFERFFRGRSRALARHRGRGARARDRLGDRGGARRLGQRGSGDGGRGTLRGPPARVAAAAATAAGAGGTLTGSASRARLAR
jgi:two-component system OmpR family sensor kinase